MLFLFCTLLISGILAGQVFDFSGIREILTLLTSLTLSYIMIEVGLEFTAEKRSVRSYGWDAVVSVNAAVLPALLWFLYFIIVLQSPWKISLLSGLSCAPTSAGVLFAMLTAAGLSATWVFQKARVLAILDDLATVLLLIPLQIVIHGLEWAAVVSVSVVFFCIVASFRWQNTLPLPTGEKWLAVYAGILSGSIFLINHTTPVHLEVLIPAFMMGCLIHKSRHSHAEGPAPIMSLDTLMKGSFMLLVGLSFPKMNVGSVPVTTTVLHVLVLTVLSNLGKCFPVLCYRKEASFQERLALGVAMFPRGEVGAAVLLIGLSYGFSGYVNTLAMLSLAFNLVLTGIFVWIIIKLLNKTGRPA